MPRIVRKSKLMKSVEARYGEPLELLLARMYNEMGLIGMSAELGVNKGTLWYWMLKFECAPVRVAVRPNEQLIVRQPTGNERTIRRRDV